MVNKTEFSDSEPRPMLPGERTNFEGKAITNTVLLSLAEEEFAALRQNLQYMDLPQHTVLQEPRHRLEFIYFLNSGMASRVFQTKNGDTVEVGVVGNVGFAPISAVAGLRSSPHQVVMQIDGSGFRLGTSVLDAAMKEFRGLQATLNRYAAVHGLQVAQTAGCNRLHDLEQRLARWLLLTQDRVGSGFLRITHDFLATMLGTDRPSVSLAAGALQRKRIIEYSHGSVKVLNRKKLENSACECYSVIRSSMERR
jgi:CRP-like cAMP-binding protein